MLFLQIWNWKFLSKNILPKLKNFKKSSDLLIFQVKLMLWMPWVELFLFKFFNFFLNVGPPEEDIFFDHLYGLYFSMSHTLHIINLLMDLWGQLPCTTSTPVTLTCGTPIYSGTYYANVHFFFKECWPNNYLLWMLSQAGFEPPFASGQYYYRTPYRTKPPRLDIIYISI